MESRSVRFQQFLDYSTSPEYWARVREVVSDPETITFAARYPGTLMDWSLRLPLVSNRIVLLEDERDRSGLKRYRLNREPIVSGNKVEAYDDTILISRSLEHVERWYAESHQLIDNGHAVFVPHIETRRKQRADYLEEVPGSGAMALRREALVDPRGLFSATLKRQLSRETNELRPLLKLEIPGLSGLTPSQLSTVISDNQPEFAAFQNFIQRRLLKLPRPDETESLDRELEVLKLEMEDAVRDLSSRVTALRRTAAISAIGGVVVPWTLYAIACWAEPGSALKFILPGGAVPALSLQLSRHLNEKWAIGREPLSFLLLLDA